MRALLIGALGLSLIGCSHSLPPQPAVVACARPSASSCAVGQPPQPMWLKAPSAEAMPVRVARTEEPSAIYARARVRLADRLAAKNDTSDKPPASATPVHIPLPRSAPRIAGSVAAAQASVPDQPPVDTKPVVEAKSAAPEPKVIQQQVAVASATEQGAVTAAQPQKKEPASRTEAANTVPMPPENPDLLVAVLMVRPDTKSVSDLAGKTIAIDERYSRSSGTVRTAIVAAGAPEVQLSEGQTTAMNRLTNGEVPAAVVALLSPEGAETFPEIKGFKIFHVPLSPRAARARP